MDRRQFSKTAIGATAAALLAPSAFASQRRTVKDCIVIDFEKKKMKWKHLSQPDWAGHKFVYEESSSTSSYRHFEFFGSDGLVVGISAPKSHWSHCYNTFEKEFLHSSMPAHAKVFTHSEFKDYVRKVEEYLQGNIVPAEALL